METENEINYASKRAYGKEGLDKRKLVKFLRESYLGDILKRLNDSQLLEVADMVEYFKEKEARG